MPVAVDDATAIVIVDEPDPGAAIDVGLKETVTPDGWPEAESATALLNPPETAVEIVEVPFPPCATETDVGDAAIVKFGVAAAVTVREIDVAWVTPPPVPVSVIGYVPVATEEETENVAVDDPDPGAAIDAGLKETVTPDG